VELEADGAPERKGQEGHDEPFQRWAQGNSAEAQTVAKGPDGAVHKSTESAVHTVFMTPSLVSPVLHTLKTAVLICYRHTLHKCHTSPYRT